MYTESVSSSVLCTQLNIALSNQWLFFCHVSNEGNWYFCSLLIHTFSYSCIALVIRVSDFFGLCKYLNLLKRKIQIKFFIEAKRKWKNEKDKLIWNKKCKIFYFPFAAVNVWLSWMNKEEKKKNKK